MKKIFYNNSGFSLVEISMVLIIIAFLMTTVVIGGKLIFSAKLSNAINLTSSAPFLNNENLILWLETSIISKNSKKNEIITTWRDLSKNSIVFTALNSNSPVLKNSKKINGLKSLYFDGTNYLNSNLALNTKKYTIFLVANAEINNNSEIYDSGFNISSNDIYGNFIVVIKNDSYNKYIKKNITSNFVKINNDNFSRPSQFFIGKNGFTGELFEIIIFNGILTDEEITNIELYLYNKYKR